MWKGILTTSLQKASDASTFQAGRWIDPLYSSLESGERGSEGASIVVRFWSTLGLWHVSCLTRTFPKTGDKDVPAKHHPKASSHHFRGHSSWGLDCPESTLPKTRRSRDHFSRGVNYLKVNSSCPEQNRCNNWLPWSLATFMESVMPPAHPYFKRVTTFISIQTVTEISKNHSSNQAQSQSLRKISTCKSCGYRNPHDSH